ncbi:MAG: DUF5702 domain-containing protein [Lutisporaceae bacterium]
MNRNCRRGAITVYLSIILSSVILLSGILMDIVRIKAAEIQVRRAVNTAAESALAGYHTKLKEDYGLFTLHNNDSSQVEEVVSSYLRKNLSIEPQEKSGDEQVYDFVKSIVVNDEYKNVHFTDIYDYKIESIQVIPIYNLTENEITRQQIIEYMKYRAPVQFAEDFMKKIDFVSSTAELTDSYKQKTVIEKKLAKVEKALIRLQSEIDKLNKFDKSYFDNRQDFKSLVKSYIEFEVQQSVYSVYSSVDIEVSENEEDEKKAEETRQYAAELYNNAERNAKDTYEKLDEHISDCLIAAQNAVREIKAMEASIDSVSNDIKVLKSNLEDMKWDDQENGFQINAALRQDIEKWEKLLDSDDSTSILKKLENNTSILNNINNKLPEISHIVSTQSGGLQSKARSNMQNALVTGGALDISGTSEYKSIVYKVLSAVEVSGIAKSSKSFELISAVMEKSNKTKGKDPRKTIVDGAKKIRDEVSDAEKRTKKIEEPKLLPSYYLNGIYPNKIFSEKLLQPEQAGAGEASAVEDFNVNLDEDSSFSEDTFGFITDLASKLQQYAKDMRDEIYINEYILATFKDEVEIEDASTDNKIKDTLFDKGEVEYILAGASSESQNHVIVKGEILLIRFGMNTLHVYSDSNKRLHSLEIATSVAGFTGFGIPVVHNLIMCAWGMAEAISDIGALYKGERVPFIKTAQTWKTDLIPSGYSVKNDVQEQESLMDFDYHDYLRLILLVQDKEVKMNRIEDLIQVNMQKSNPEFKLSGYNTYIKVNAQVSIKYWFLTRIFVPSKLKTADGRHRINIEAWKGY